jgi:hypothetical protein
LLTFTVHPEDVDGRELAFTFMESRRFDEYREFPFSGAGISLEEAFFGFCEDVQIGDPVAREQEFLAAMMKLLATSPTAPVHLPECIRPTTRGWFAVSARGAPVLFATVRGRYATGPLTPFLVDLLVQEMDAAAAAARHGVSHAVLEECVRRFSELGIYDPPAVG